MRPARRWASISAGLKIDVTGATAAGGGRRQGAAAERSAKAPLAPGAAGVTAAAAADLPARLGLVSARAGAGSDPGAAAAPATSGIRSASPGAQYHHAFHQP